MKIPGWYIEFQAALLRQAPRPDEIDQVTAEGWTSNQKGLKKNLAGCLLPMPVETPTEPGKSEPVPSHICHITTPTVRVHRLGGTGTLSSTLVLEHLFFILDTFARLIGLTFGLLRPYGQRQTRGFFFIQNFAVR